MKTTVVIKGIIYRHGKISTIYYCVNKVSSKNTYVYVLLYKIILEHRHSERYVYTYVFNLKTIVCLWGPWFVLMFLFSQSGKSTDDLSAMTLNLLVYPPDVHHYWDYFLWSFIWGILRWYKCKHILRSYSQIISNPCMITLYFWIVKE